MSVVNKLYTKDVILRGTTSGTLTHKPAATTTSYTVTWPSAVGGANTFLKTDNSGNLSWSAVAASALDDLTDVTTTTTGEVLNISPTVFTFGENTVAKLNPNNDLTCSLGDATHRYVDVHHRNNKMYGSTSGVLTVSPAATVTDYTLTFPAAAGAANTVMTTSGSGTLQFVNALSGLTTIGMTGTLTSTNGDLTFSKAGAVFTLGTATLTESSGNLTLNNSLTVSTNLVVTGNFTVNGTVTTVNTTNLNVTDPFFGVGANNSSSDLVDLGFWSKYNDGSTRYAGLFRDQSDSGKFKLFKGTTEDLSAVTTVNTGASGYAAADLVIAALTATSVTASAAITAGTGLTVTSGGATITAGGLAVSADGATITGATSVTGAISASTTITAGTGLTATTGGLTVSAGGATITGATAVTGAISASTTVTAGTGLTVTSGGASITGTAAVTGAITASTTVTAGTGLTVTSGGLTVSAGGAAITGAVSASTTVTAGTGLTVSAGGAAITGNSSVTGKLTFTNEINEVKEYSGAGAHVLNTDGKRVNVVTHTTSATVTLPTAPTTGTVYEIIDNLDAGTLTINAGGSDTVEDGVGTSYTLTEKHQRLTLQYIATTTNWYII
jgi:hypothetical protein